MTKQKAQWENLKEHCNEMSKSNMLWKNDVIALNILIDSLNSLKMDQYLKKIKEKNDLVDKIVKIKKILLIIQTIFSFIIFDLIIFKNIFTFNLIFLILMFTIAIISIILTEKEKKLRNEALEIARKLEFKINKHSNFIKGEEE